MVFLTIDCKEPTIINLLFKVQPCSLCRVLLPHGVIPPEGEYMTVSYEDQQYSLNTPVPLDMATHAELHKFSVTCFCLASCHNDRGLVLKVKILLQNVISGPSERQFGVFQDDVELSYSFITSPYPHQYHFGDIDIE